MPHQKATIPQGVLNDAKYRPYQDEPRRRVKREQVLLPRQPHDRMLFRRGQERERAPMEHPRHCDEEAEPQDLDPQPGEDDVLAQGEAVLLVPGHDTGPARLDEEGEDVAADEHGREPALGDHGEALALRDERDAAEDHVDGGGEEGGGDEEEEGLHDERAEGQFIVVGEGAADVA